MLVRNALIIPLALAMLASSASAQNRRPQPRSQAPAATAGKSLCVDVVSVRQGKPAKGLIIASQGDHLLMAVEREVLRRDNPALYQRAAEAERDQAEKAWTQLRDRLQEQLRVDKTAAAPSDPANAGDEKTAKNSPALRELLQRELARAERELETLAAHPGEPLETRFLWLELSSREIQSAKRASPAARSVAVWAWREHMKDVSTRDMADLERELAEEKIDPKLPPPDLSRELAPREQSDDQWAARLAIVRYALGSPLDFQGSNGVFVPTGGGAPAVDPSALIQKMMSGNLDALLADLDPTARKSSGSGDDWIKSVAAQAEGMHRTEFCVTRLDPDPSGQAASVEVAFVAKLPSTGWHVVWSTKHTTQASQISREAEQQIAADPQVKMVLGLLSALGAGAEAEVQKAIRFGAATMEAQRAAQSRFYHFRDRYIQRLDGPPL